VLQSYVDNRHLIRPRSQVRTNSRPRLAPWICGTSGQGQGAFSCSFSRRMYWLRSRIEPVAYRITRRSRFARDMAAVTWLEYWLVAFTR